jgi:hypothetical protein
VLGCRNHPQADPARYQLKDAIMLKRCWLVPLSALLMATLSGCSGGYVIEGKAIRGEFTSVSFVRASDSRLSEPGVANVEISVFRNPDTLGRAMVAKGTTDDQGNLYLPVDVFGVGWTIEQWMIHSYRPGIAQRAPQADEAYQQYEKFK